jgi:LPXTG-motif cell wall-anchored protein
MPVHMMVIWYANQHSALLAILGLLFGALVGGVLYIVLKKRERKRLDPESDK